MMFIYLLLCVSLAVAQEIAPLSKKLDQFVQKKSVAGAIAMVYWKGEVIHYSAHGMRDVLEKKSLKKDSLMRIYSMTKPLTSVAVMILREQKKLKLDDPISLYLPELSNLKVYRSKELTRETTVRDLLRHTSGFTYGFFSKTPVDRLYMKNHPLYSSNNREMTKKLSAYPLLFQPGEKWHYSVSTDVLGDLVERVSGMPLAEFFTQYITNPLGMNDTSFYVPKEKIDRFASSYGRKHKIHESYTNSHFLIKDRIQSGGGGLISTASDYMKFCMMLLGKGELDGVRILSEKNVLAMTKNKLPKGVFAYDLFGFGLGFLVQLHDWGNHGHIGEYGWDGAASTHFWISPSDDLIVILLSQRQPYSDQLKKSIKPIVYRYIENHP